MICDDCIEPLARAQVKIYLPDDSCYDKRTDNSWPHYPAPLSEEAVARKEERLLAVGRLNERGDFSLDWDQLHLFTEPLELDISLDHMPGKAPGRKLVSQYHLGSPALHWKRLREKYLAAFAYVIPSGQWAWIRGRYQTWAISGTVRHFHSTAGQPGLRVKAYNATDNRLLGEAFTSRGGKYKLQFGLKDITSGAVMPVRQGQYHKGPDVYFKVYKNKQLIWEENPHMADYPERRAIAPCTVLNITIGPSYVRKKAASCLSGWLGGWTVVSGHSKRYAGEHPLC